jgi:hypothetical protein
VKTRAGFFCGEMENGKWKKFTAKGVKARKREKA